MSVSKIVDLRSSIDERGSLVFLEENIETTFPIKRIYYIFGNDSNISRGFHAHKSLQQLLICLQGKCSILLDNGNQKEVVDLTSPYQGLLIEKMIWREMHNFSPDCILLVIASNYHDENDYIRDYEEFTLEVNQ